ncbi:MAG: hypothetical protein RLY93_02765 [Sumerlaeia bacterium]
MRSPSIRLIAAIVAVVAVAVVLLFRSLVPLDGEEDFLDGHIVAQVLSDGKLLKSRLKTAYIHTSEGELKVVESTGKLHFSDLIVLGDRSLVGASKVCFEFEGSDELLCFDLSKGIHSYGQSSFVSDGDKVYGLRMGYLDGMVDRNTSKEFTRSEWLETRENLRYVFVDDLITTNILLTEERKNVVELLGKPHPPGFPLEAINWDLAYKIGDAGIDHYWLLIQVGSQGEESHFTIYKD